MFLCMRRFPVIFLPHVFFPFFETFLPQKAYILSFFVVTCHVSRYFTMDDKLIIQSVEAGSQLFFLTIHWWWILEKNIYIKLFLL